MYSVLHTGIYLPFLYFHLCWHFLVLFLPLVLTGASRQNNCLHPQQLPPCNSDGTIPLSKPLNSHILHLTTHAFHQQVFLHGQQFKCPKVTHPLSFQSGKQLMPLTRVPVGFDGKGLGSFEIMTELVQENFRKQKHLTEKFDMKLLRNRTVVLVFSVSSGSLLVVLCCSNHDSIGAN